MKELHEKENNNTNIQPKDGQRDFLCSNNLVNRCPSLDYVEVESEDRLEKAFDILFTEILRVNNQDDFYEP